VKTPVQYLFSFVPYINLKIGEISMCDIKF
jgi:hypothetical protein